MSSCPTRSARFIPARICWARLREGVGVFVGRALGVLGVLDTVDCGALVEGGVRGLDGGAVVFVDDWAEHAQAASSTAANGSHRRRTISPSSRTGSADGGSLAQAHR